MILFIVLFSLDFYHGISVVFPRSNHVIILHWSCTEKGINGKIVAEGTSTRFESDFYLDKSETLHFDQDVPVKWVKSLPVDLEENSKVTIQLFPENQTAQTYTFAWSSQNLSPKITFGCLEIFIKQCSLSGPANEFETEENCQAMWYILPKDLEPVGFLAINFYPNGEQELSVSINSKWEEETLNKGDFYINTGTIGITAVWDENNLKLRIGDKKETALSIKNSRERQIFYFLKMRIFYVPFSRYNQGEYHFILFINNTNDLRGKLVAIDEIVISVFDKQIRQPLIASTRIIGRILPEDWKFLKGKIMAFQQAESVIVQIKGHKPYLARDVGVFPIIYSPIRNLNRQMVIPGLKRNFIAALVLSKKPITSLTDWYLVKIKARPDDLRFQFCVKTAEKPCTFKDSDRFDSYQQFSTSLSILEKIVLRCCLTETILSTEFQTEETTTSFDILGVLVEVDIRRNPLDQNNAKWSLSDNRLLANFAIMKNKEKMIA